MSGWGWVMMSFGLVFWLALIGLLFWAISEWATKRDTGRPSSAESPREILDRRFARGELDLEEYRRALDALSGREPAPR